MRERRFLMWSVLLLLLLSVVLTGCDTVLGLVFKPDLTVTSVDPLMGDTGELTGVRLVFENWGIVSADPATYAVVMSADEVVSLAADTTVYEGTITLAANDQTQIDLTGDDIMAWIESHYDNLELTAPSYFLGAVVDVNNDVEESDELNNEMSSNTSFEMGGTGGGGGGGSITPVLGIYSESRDVYPTDWSYDGVGVDFSSTNTPAYDGSVSLEANFPATGTYWVVDSFSAPVDVSVSSYLVFALDSSASAQFQVLMFSKDIATFPVVNVDPTVPHGTGYKVAVGQGPNGNWDIFAIPFSVFTSQGFDPAQLTDWKFGGGDLNTTLFLDDIHLSDSDEWVDNSIITVDLTDNTSMGDVDGNDFVYYVLSTGAPRNLLTSVYAVGSAVISGGVAAATAEAVVDPATLATSGTWYGNTTETYDVYPFIDMNGNRLFDSGTDLDLTATPLTISMDGDGESRTVDRADFN